MSGAIYIAQQTYTSLKVQKYVMGEIDSDPKMALDEVKDAFPSIPNLSTSTLPIPALMLDDRNRSVRASNVDCSRIRICHTILCGTNCITSTNVINS